MSTCVKTKPVGYKLKATPGKSVFDTGLAEECLRLFTAHSYVHKAKLSPEQGQHITNICLALTALLIV